MGGRRAARGRGGDRRCAASSGARSARTRYVDSRGRQQGGALLPDGERRTRPLAQNEVDEVRWVTARARPPRAARATTATADAAEPLAVAHLAARATPEPLRTALRAPSASQPGALVEPPRARVLLEHPERRLGVLAPRAAPPPGRSAPGRRRATTRRGRRRSRTARRGRARPGSGRPTRTRPRAPSRSATSVVRPAAATRAVARQRLSSTGSASSSCGREDVPVGDLPAADADRARSRARRCRWRPHGCTRRRRVGSRAVELEHVLVVGCRPDGRRASRRSSPRRAGASRCSTRTPAPSSAGSRRCGEASTKLAAKGGPDPEATLARVPPVDELVAGRPDDRGDRRGRGREGGRLPPRRRGAARPRRSSRRTRARSRSRSLAAATARPGPRDRDALLQPGAGAEARRGDPRGADLGRDGRRDRRARPRARQGARRGATTSRASSRTGS